MSDNSDKPILSLVESATKPRKIKPNTDNSKTAGGGSGGGRGRSKSKTFGSYTIVNGAFNQVKTTHDGTVVEFPLCDFTCKIVEEITADDGLVDSAFLRIQGAQQKGGLLPIVDVPAKNFFSVQNNWANEAWGTRAFIYPGSAKKDNLRACIQLFSNLDTEIPKRTIFKYTGWKKINEQWHYLTGSGALTAGGVVSGIEVDLGGGHMSRYQLPPPLAGDELKQAVGSALDFLDICPNKPHIAATLLAAVARAPLAECHCIDFAIWLHGLTGSRKSAVTAIALAFFGDFTARSFPSNWSDSVNDAEAKSHQTKDSIFVIDDFKPSVSLNEASKLHAMAERIVRNTGNQAGRGRRGSAMESKPTPYNRSMLLITGEDLPRGQSLLGRLLILELSGTDVDNDLLTQLQKDADLGKFTGLMAAYLVWLAPRLDQLKKDFPKKVQLFRDAAIRAKLATSHPRAAEIYANLTAGFETFLNFLQDADLVGDSQCKQLLLGMESNLQQAFNEQSEYQTNQDEALRFLDLLKAVLISGNGHISCRLNQGPPKIRPHGWGWRDSSDNPVGDKNMNPTGDCIGWYCGASEGETPEIWLQQDAAFKSVQQYARSQGDAFLMTAPTLWRRMFEKGFILKTEVDPKRNKPRLSIRRTIDGSTKRVMVIKAELVETDM